MDEQHDNSGDPLRIRRRTIVAGLTVAGAAIGAGVLADSASADSPSADSPRSQRIGSLEPGSALPGTQARIIAVYPVTYGALPVVLELSGGVRFQVDVLARDNDGPAGVGNTEHYSVYVANRGDGGTSTDEAQGLAAMALARALEAQSADLPDLMTLRARETAHPDGTFGVPLTP